MDVFDWIWIVWAAVLAGSFAVIEGIALVRKRPEDTLSDHLRAWFHTNTHLGRTIWLAAFGALAVWLLTHIAVAGSV